MYNQLPTDAAVQQMQDTAKPITTVSSDSVGNFLEYSGWKRDIAGDDFDRIVKAICTAHPIRRGLLVTGDAGCGKTHLLKTLEKNYHGVFLYCKDKEDIKFMRQRFIEDGVRNIFIDDLGCEEITREYGTVVDAVGDFIQFLHSRFNGRVFISTNLNSKQINEKYGTRCLDRILEMCVCTRMSGKSKRKVIVV